MPVQGQACLYPDPKHISLQHQGSQSCLTEWLLGGIDFPAIYMATRLSC